MWTYRTFSGLAAEHTLTYFCNKNNILPNKCHITYNSELHCYVLFYINEKK